MSAVSSYASSYASFVWRARLLPIESARDLISPPIAGQRNRAPLLDSDPLIDIANLAKSNRRSVIRCERAIDSSWPYKY